MKVGAPADYPACRSFKSSLGRAGSCPCCMSSLYRVQRHRVTRSVCCGECDGRMREAVPGEWAALRQLGIGLDARWC